LNIKNLETVKANFTLVSICYQKKIIRVGGTGKCRLVKTVIVTFSLHLEEFKRPIAYLMNNFQRSFTKLVSL